LGNGISLIRSAAAAGAAISGMIFAGAGAGTAAAIRAADALAAALFGPVNIAAGSSHDDHENSDHNQIGHVEHSFSEKLLFCAVFGSQALVSLADQTDQHSSKHQDRDQAAHEPRAHSAGGDQGADLIDQEADGIAGA